MSDYKSAIAGLSFRAVYFTDFNAHGMPEGGRAPWDLSMAGETPDLPKVGRLGEPSLPFGTRGDVECTIGAAAPFEKNW